MRRNSKLERGSEELLQLRDAALQLDISFPTIKQWIYKKKIRSVQTAGGHHRIPQSEVDKLLFRTRGRNEEERKQMVRRVSGRNQLVGRIDSVRISGLMAEVKISIGGQQITSIITATSAREMQLRVLKSGLVFRLCLQRFNNSTSVPALQGRGFQPRRKPRQIDSAALAAEAHCPGAIEFSRNPCRHNASVVLINRAFRRCRPIKKPQPKGRGFF
jgi:molybdopterin-binding protein